MPTEERIRRAVDGLKSVYHLRSVSIFGSYAEGRATANSDLDLLVEFDTPAVSLVKLNALKYDFENLSPCFLPNNVIRAVFELQNDASAGLRFLRQVYQIYHIQLLTRRNGIVGKAPHQRVIAFGACREERSIIVSNALLKLFENHSCAE